MCDADAARLRAAIMSEMQQAYDEGHSFLPTTEIYERVGGNKKKVRRALYELLKNGRLQRDQGAEIYLPNVLKAEVDVAKHVKRLLAAGNMGIIVGPPGSGKTTRVRELVRDWRGPVFLTAVTGRAAARLAEASAVPAHTVARLLGFDGEKYRLGEANRLPRGLVVLDEASLLDVVTAAAFFSAIENGSSVWLVGDTDQLASVGPGQVLRDLVSWGRIPTVRLHQVFRQTRGSKLTRVARLIRGARTLSVQSDGEWRFVQATSWDAVINLTVAEVARLATLGEQAQVLAPTRAMVHQLNMLLQELLNATSKSAPAVEVDGELIAVGDRVVVNRNDHRLGVWNGQLGQVAKVDKRAVSVAIDGRVVEFATATLGPDASGRTALTLGYCLTIHRAQGSEFDHVVVAFPPSRMGTRNILYTALTRARRTCTLVSHPVTVARALATTNRRYTKLLTRLRQP